MSTNLNQTHTDITCHIPSPLEHIKIRPDHSPAKLSTLKVGEWVDEKEGLIDPFSLAPELTEKDLKMMMSAHLGKKFIENTIIEMLKERSPTCS